MQTITQAGKVNMIPGSDSPLRIQVSQWDAGSRTLSFTLYAGQAVYTVPSGATVTCDGTRPSGGGFSVSASASGSTVTVGISDQMTAEAGLVRCQITVRDGDDALGSANFILQVEEGALMPGGVVSASGFEELVTAAVTAYMEAHPEAAAGIPAGGSAGQVVTRDSSGNAVWQNLPIWIGTLAAYDAMGSHDAGTVYLIPEAGA